MTNVAKRLAKVLIAVTTAIFLYAVGDSFAYEPFMDQVDRWPSEGEFEESYYNIDIHTILLSINQGDTSLFIPTSREPSSSWLADADAPLWPEANFVKVAAALHRVVNADEFTDWGVLWATFQTACRAQPQGFASAQFIIFKSQWLHRQLHYQARSIYVDLPNGLVSWGEGYNYPRPPLGWNGIDLNDSNMNAEHALKIAEEAGGRAWRSARYNECRIFAIAINDEWRILYSSTMDWRSANYVIDSRNGRVVGVQEN